MVCMILCGSGLLQSRTIGEGQCGLYDTVYCSALTVKDNRDSVVCTILYGAGL